VTAIDCDLVVVSVGGVQQFIAEARSTADVAAGSRLLSEIAAAMCAVVIEPAELVMPEAARGDLGLPNRVVAVTQPGTGAALAGRMVDAAVQSWQDRVLRLWPAAGPSAPGFPVTQWVVVEPTSGGYRQQWERAVEAMAARKRTRTFPRYEARTVRRLCALSGRWPEAERGPQVWIRRRRGEALSVPAVVKRHAAAQLSFPSTWSIATAPTRYEIARRAEADERVRGSVRVLRQAVEALNRFGVRFGSGRLAGLRGWTADEARWVADIEGACLVPETWTVESVASEHNITPTDTAAFGSAVAHAREALMQVFRTAEVDQPSPYLSVVAQDADRMGRRLSGGAGAGDDLRAWHRRVSAALVEAGDDQRRCLEDSGVLGSGQYGGGALGKLVYAGGDDLLGFVPVRTALRAAQALNDSFATLVGGESGPVQRATASTAIVFFHASSSLQTAMAGVRSLLEEAKRTHRPGFGVAVWRRGGERARAVGRWRLGSPMRGSGAPQALEAVVEAMRNGLSGRLVADLEREREPMRTLSGAGREAELRRLVRRHAAANVDADAAADALLALSADGEVRQASASQWAATARFVSSEGRG
jgi:CRISPR-associated protein Cmr2